MDNAQDHRGIVWLNLEKMTLQQDSATLQKQPICPKLQGVERKHIHSPENINEKCKHDGCGQGYPVLANRFFVISVHFSCRWLYNPTV